MAQQGTPKVAIGADHGGYSLKEELKKHLTNDGYTVIDCGTHHTSAVDYPVFARLVAEKVSSGEARFGIMIDGAGIGSSMVANKVRGVRAAMCYDLSTANNAREHNDANLLTLGAGLIGSNLARQIVNTFLTVECTEDRHKRRVAMIDGLDQGRPELAPAPVPETVTTAAAAPSASGEKTVSDVSSDDIQRIAERVRALIGTQGGAVAHTTDHVCGDDNCTLCGLCAIKAPTHVRQMIEMGAGRISLYPGDGQVPKDIAKYIDHTLLKPEATEADVRKLCQEAAEFEFASVCINPNWVPVAKQELNNSSVKVCTVVGFPLGAHASEIKAAETRKAIRDGATEIDMVINIGALKSGDTDRVYRDIRAVVEACEDGGALSKVIIETALLTDEEKRTACELSKRARANYVKTSTGFAKGGATAEDVALMSSVVASSGMGVKASGGIRDFGDAQKMIDAGATRIGASAGIKIIQGSKAVTVSE